MTSKRRRLVAAIVACAVVIGGGLAAATAGDGGDGGDADDDVGGAVAPETTTTTLRTGGIDVPAPDDWLTIPVPQLGFGVAVPPGWEATLLSEEVLQALARSSPEVPGFLESARNAALAGAVLYAAGQDDDGRVSDLKVRAAPETGITGSDGLEAYGNDLVRQAGDQISDATVEVVEGAERPTVRMRYRVAGQAGRGEDVTAEGTETLTLGPRGIVWSVIVTSEDAAGHDELAARITDTLTLAPA